MKKTYIIIAGFILSLSLVANLSQAAIIKPSKKPTYKHTQVVGYLEKVRVPHVDVVFRAKMDTGADTSSMNAEIIDMKKGSQTEDGKGYVIFTLDSDGGKSSHIKRPLVRVSRIKLRGGGLQRRPVIKLDFCIAGVLVHEEVNLSNRENFKYDLLVGRNMIIKAGLIIDSNQTYTSKPNCAEEK
jgi:hypothetical protein